MEKATTMILTAAPVPDPRHTVLHEISGKDIAVARTYLMYTCVIALVSCAWTLNNYIDGPSAIRAYSWIGTISSTMLVLGMMLEGAVYLRVSASTHNRVLIYAQQHGLGVSVVHIATSTICIFSICIAAVNIHNNVSTGLYGLSVAAIALNWGYQTMFTPNNTMHIAIFGSLSESQQYVVSLQQRAINYVWRTSKLNPIEI